MPHTSLCPRMQTCLTQNSSGVSREGAPIVSSSLQEAEQGSSTSIQPRGTTCGENTTTRDEILPLKHSKAWITNWQEPFHKAVHPSFPSTPLLVHPIRGHLPCPTHFHKSLFFSFS